MYLLLQGEMERRAPSGVPHVKLGALAYEQPHDAVIPLLRRNVPAQAVGSQHLVESCTCTTFLQHMQAKQMPRAKQKPRLHCNCELTTGSGAAAALARGSPGLPT